uniref:Uncharacterized protein n=1 Tax=Macrostomum lignano TaxID=282301 RepID=A0A1I8FP54_9PLAT
MESLADDAGSSLLGQRGQSPRHRKKRKSFLSRLSGSNRCQRRGQWRRRQDPKEAGRDWQHMSTAGESQLQESARRLRGRQSRVCLLVCRVCHVDGAQRDAFRCRQTVPCLPPMAKQAPAALLQRCHCRRQRLRLRDISRLAALVL